MRRETRWLWLRVLPIVTLCAMPLDGWADAQTPATGLPTWFAGCWASTVRGERAQERWIAADRTTLLGVAHTVKGDTLSAFEFLRVVVKNGTPTYVAQPGGVPPTEFAATSQTASTITFENAVHDFPKRVGYERLDATHLTAWIDGGAGEAGKRLEYPMVRVPCEP